MIFIDYYLAKGYSANDGGSKSPVSAKIAASSVHTFKQVYDDGNFVYGTIKICPGESFIKRVDKKSRPTS